MPKHPLILAHRGARRFAPENTISAFKKAIELEVDGVEFDVMSTMDGVPVVVHNNFLSGLTGRPVFVNNSSLADLMELDVGRGFDPYFEGERIPTLSEVLELLAPTKLILNIELKHQPRQYGRFVERVMEIIRGYLGRGTKDESSIILSSFSLRLLRKVERLAPDIKTALLCRPKFFFIKPIIFAKLLNVDGVNPSVGSISKWFVTLARRQGLNIITWTANTHEEIQRAIELGVDGIITDEPLLAKKMTRGQT